MLTAIFIMLVLLFFVLCAIYARLGEISGRYEADKEDRELRKRAQKIKRANKRVALENPGSSQAALARISDWLDPLRNPLQGE